MTWCGLRGTVVPLGVAQIFRGIFFEGQATEIDIVPHPSHIRWVAMHGNTEILQMAWSLRRNQLYHNVYNNVYIPTREKLRE